MKDMVTVVLGCLKLDFVLDTSCGWQHKNMIAEEVERVEVGHPLWYSTMETVVLGSWLTNGHRKCFFQLVDAPFLMLYVILRIDGHTGNVNYIMPT